jgi:hypothetical protein
MGRFPKVAATEFKNLGKVSISAAFGNPSMWSLAAYGNPFMTALVAYKKSVGISKLFQNKQFQTNLKYLRNYDVKNFKNQNLSSRNWWFNFIDPKNNLQYLVRLSL